LFNSLMWQ